MRREEQLVEIRHSTRRRRTVTAFRERDTIVVCVPARLPAAEEARHVDALVAQLLAREARRSTPRAEDDLTRRARDLSVRLLAPTLGEAPLPTRVSWVANQQRRWGSCTPADRTIRLSSRLQPMPSWVSDYVLVHELVHLVEPTHSGRFHDLVATYPQTERARGYLEGYADAARLPSLSDLDDGAEE